jgi:B-cell receptor-associated protein 31
VKKTKRKFSDPRLVRSPKPPNAASSSSSFLDSIESNHETNPREGKMIQLLFLVLVAEAAVAAVLLFKTPLRKLAVMGIDRLKRGRRAPVAVKTVAGVVLALLASTLYSMAEISGRAGGDPESGGGGGGGASLSPTDQVLFSRHLLEASLMGRCWLLDQIGSRVRRPDALSSWVGDTLIACPFVLNSSRIVFHKCRNPFRTNLQSDRY